MGIHGVAQSSVSGGSYSASFNVSMLDGSNTTIAANQGDSSKYAVSVDVDVSDGSSDSSVSATTITAADVTIEEVDSSAVNIHGLSITADAIEGATTIDVSGSTDRNGEIVLTAPNGNIVSVAQVTPSGDSYMTTIGVADMDDCCTISAQQGQGSGKYNLSVDVSASETSASASSLITSEATTAAVTTSTPTLCLILVLE
jgi:hypothetical protein